MKNTKVRITKDTKITRVKKSCYIFKDFDNSDDDDMVYIVVKDESDDENDKMTLISYVRKNYT